MKYIFVLITITTSLFVRSTYAQSDNDSILYTKSVKSYDEKKFKKALTYINQAIDKNGSKSTYYSFKGEILYAINHDIDELFSYLTKSVEVEPSSPYPLINRAYFYEQITEIQNAILDYNDALKLAKEDSTIVSIYINRGGLLNKIQKNELAYEDLSKAYQMDSNNIGLLNNYALCLEDLGKKQEAKKTLLRMIEIDSLFVPAWMNLGFQASLRSEFDDALKYLNKADELEPNQPYTLNNRGYVKMKLNDLNGALEDINRSIEIDSQNSYAYRNKALVYIEKEDLDLACENLYLSKKYGFSIYYGNEIEELIKKHCIK